MRVYGFLGVVLTMRETVILRIVAPLDVSGSYIRSISRRLTSQNIPDRNGCKHAKNEVNMPNTSKITQVMSVRLKNDIAIYIRKDKHNALNKVVESLYREVLHGNIKLRAGEVILPKGRDRKGWRVVELEEKVYQSLEDTLYIDGLEASEFIKMVVEAVDKGLIWVEKGQIVVQNAQRG